MSGTAAGVAVGLDEGDDLGRTTPCPPNWEKVCGDVSWISKEQRHQEMIEELIAVGDFCGLQAQHPRGQEFMQAFMAQMVENGADFIRSLREKAIQAKDEVPKVAARALQELEELQAQLQAQEHSKSAAELGQLCESVLADVAASTESLREVGIDSLLSPLQVLTKEYGSERAAQITDRAEAMQKLVPVRVEARINTSICGVERLQEGNGPLAQLLEISAADHKVEELQKQAAEAQEFKQIAQDTLVAQQHSLEEQKELLARCEHEKRKNLPTGDARRSDLKKALKQAEAANSAYKLWSIENELLRLQIERLKSSIAQTGEELSAAELEWPETEVACDRLLQTALAEEKVVREQQAETAEWAVQESAEAIAAVALNVEVSIKLSERARADKQARKERLEQENGTLELAVAQSKTRLQGSARGDTLKQFYQQKERQSQLATDIQACCKTLDELDLSISGAESQRRSIDGLRTHGLSIKEGCIAERAQTLVDDAYAQMQGFTEGVITGEVMGADASLSGGSSLALALPGGQGGVEMQALVHEITKQVRASLLQQRADEEIRGKTQAATAVEQE